MPTETSKKRLLLFGGTNSLVEAARIAESRNYSIVVFSEPFRLDNRINESGTLRDNLKNFSLELVEVEQRDANLLRPYVTETTVALSVSTSWIFSTEIIDLFRGRFFNVHPAILPQERGSAGYSWKIMMDCKFGGWTVHEVSPRIDTGNIVFQRTIEYPLTATVPADYQAVLAKLEPGFFEEFFTELELGWKSIPQVQSEEESYYFPALYTPIHGFVDWSWSTDEIVSFIRAFDEPHEGASTFLEGQLVRLKGADFHADHHKFHPFQSGIVFRNISGKIHIAANTQAVTISSVTDELGQRVSLRAGQRFFTPTRYLDRAKSIKIRYGPNGMKITSQDEETTSPIGID